MPTAPKARATQMPQDCSKEAQRNKCSAVLDLSSLLFEWLWSKGEYQLFPIEQILQSRSGLRLEILCGLAVWQESPSKVRNEETGF